VPKLALPSFVCALLRVIVVAVACIPTMASAARPAFTALLRNGERIEGERLDNWHTREAQPSLSGRELLTGSNPMRWVRDRTLAPTTPPNAFVEMIGGDRLPGEVINFVGSDSQVFSALPDHLLVTPLIDLQPPKAPDQPEVRVLTRFVRRIVWHRSQQVYQPGVAFFRDGKKQTFRRVRFTPGAVNLLSDQGLQQVFFNELSELHLPEQDAWDAYLDELALLAPNLEGLLLRFETTSGARITSSVSRFNAAVKGNAADFRRWMHALHPAWCLDALWLSGAEVYQRQAFDPAEAPLSRFTPVKVRQSALLTAGARRWRTDRNARGSLLTCGGKEFGFGFGVHGETALTFKLPQVAATLRSAVGIDDAVAQGGCVKARVLMGEAASKAWESSFLLGSAEAVDTGALTLPPDRLVTFEIDAAHQGRPAGADPLDIRDLADWLDPIVAFDPEPLKKAIQPHIPKQIPALRGWKVLAAADLQPIWQTHWDDAAPSPGAFRMALEMPHLVSLVRQMDVRPEDRHLLIFAHYRPADGPAPKLEIHIDGEPAGEFELPPYDVGRKDPAPIAFNLSGYAGASLTIELVQIAPGPIVWEAIRPVTQLPTIYELFDDDGQFAAVEQPPQGTAKLFNDDRHSGVKSLEVTPSGQFRRDFANPIPVRQTPDWGEYRYLRVALRKFGGGRASIELNHNGAPDRVVRYDAGQGEPSHGEAKRFWIQNLPSEWIVMTLDLYDDFGEFEVTGLTLSSPDGERVLFDHIFLGRARSDLDKLPAIVPPEVANQKARRELVQGVVDKGLPATVSIGFSDGRVGAGVIISAQGHILTAGHLVVKSGDPAVVHLADGRTVKATTQGVFREQDLGLVKIEEEAAYPFLPINTATDLDPHGLYVGVAFRSPLATDSPPESNVSALRQVFRGMIWTTFDMEHWLPGGPLLDEAGRLLGVHVRRSRFGGFLYTRVHDAGGHIERMKKGEVFGDWAYGSSPVLGVEIKSVRAGAQVVKVAAESPPEGIALDDVITKVEGRSVVSLADIYEQLANNNPGDKIAVELLRNDKPQTLQVELLPRTP